MSLDGDTLSSRSATVGIIANPASGKDIRRLVGHATTVDNQGKVGILRRALVGLGAIGVRQVYVMPDTQRLGERAYQGLPSDANAIPQVCPIDMPVSGLARDSERAAAALAHLGVGCIIVLGGDGTVRAVSKGSGDTPLLPISTGTNNVLPDFVEATLAGLAAGAIALAIVPRREVAHRHKWLEVVIDGRAVDRALVDVAVLNGGFVGARAVWQADDLRQVVVTRAEPTSIGISAIAGMIAPISPREARGLALWLDPASERRVLVPLGPGLVPEIGIARTASLGIGASVLVAAERPLVLALDGEREHVLQPGREARVTLRDDGPWIVSVHDVMHHLVETRGMERSQV